MYFDTMYGILMGGQHILQPCLSFRLLSDFDVIIWNRISYRIAIYIFIYLCVRVCVCVFVDFDT
jgi:hypothetical protein